jgi:outer membrane protein assembly factor BamB
MLAAALALSLSAGAGGSWSAPNMLPPVPRALYRVAWRRPFVPLGVLEFQPVEAGGVASDPASGLVVFGTRDGWLHAVRPDRSLAWEFRALAGFAGAPALAAGVVYAGARDGRLYALELGTGKELWRYDSNEELGTRPVVRNGVVYVASLQDTVFAVDATTGAWKWHHRREGKGGFSIRGAADVVAGEGVVYGAYSDGNVASLDASTGRVLWERSIAPDGAQLDVDGLVLDGGRLYAAAYSGAVAALDPKTGTVIWSVKVPGAHVLTVGSGLVFVVTPSAVVALGTADGGQAWSTPLANGSAAGTPVLVDRWLVVPAALGGLRWMEAATGRPLRVFDPGNGVSGLPAVAGRRMYVLSNGGALFALDLS